MDKPANEKKQTDTPLLRPEELKYTGLIINSIIHSFNNAIGVIRGYADLSLRATEPDNGIYPYLESIVEGADSIKALSDKMRILSAQVRQDMRPVPIRDVVAEAVNAFAATVAPPVTVGLDIDRDCGTVWADAGQIRQAVTNLCNNAYEAARANGGLIDVVLQEADVDASFAQGHQSLSEGKHVKFTVRDTGGGMAPDVIRQMYQPFFTTKDPGEHAGLGLCVVEEIAKRHKGAVTVKNVPGQGVAFDIYLPVADHN